MSNNESQLAIFLTSSEGLSRGRLYLTLAALQCIDSKELNLFLFVQHPQIGNAYVTEGKITLKYKSKSEFLGKKRLRLIRLSLLTNPLLSSDMCFLHVSFLSMVTPNSLEAFTKMFFCIFYQCVFLWKMHRRWASHSTKMAFYLDITVGWQVFLGSSSSSQLPIRE